MTRRRGEVTARMHERTYPHPVELEHPPDGFELVLLHAMETFHTERLSPPHERRRA